MGALVGLGDGAKVRAEGEADGRAVTGDLVGLCVGAFVAAADGEVDGAAEAGARVSLLVGVVEGEVDGAFDSGDLVGLCVEVTATGAVEGTLDGTVVCPLGAVEGDSMLGEFDGLLEGVCVDIPVGELLLPAARGEAEGETLGDPLEASGDAVGVSLGDRLEPSTSGRGAV
jgi:hypothetical protein